MGKLLVITYKTADGKHICVEVTTEVKELLEQSERQMQSQRRQDRRYLTKENYVDGFTDTTIICPKEDIADLVCRMDSYEKLHAAIATLPELHQHRLHLYYNDELTYKQIAKLENVHHTTIARSLKKIRRFLRKYLTD